MSSFIERLNNYANGLSVLRDWVGTGGVPVEQHVAQARANICLDCPHNREGVKLADTIAAAVKEQIELKNHLHLHVNGEYRLKSCMVCDCVNRLQIWCPDKLFEGHYTAADMVRYPPECWKRILIENKKASPGRQSGTGQTK